MLLEEHDEPLRVEFRFREATGRCGAGKGLEVSTIFIIS